MVKCTGVTTTIATRCRGAILTSESQPRWSRQWEAVGGLAGFDLLSAFFIVCVFQMGAAGRDEQRIAERRAIDPERPWLWSDEWLDGRFRASGTTGGALAMLVVALGWDAVTVGGVWALHAGDGWTGGTLIWAIAFSAGGVFLTGYTIRGVLQRWKYPPAEFQMETVPGVLGGRVTGWVQLPDAVRPDAESSVSITCERIWRGGRHTSVHKLWEDRTQLPVPPSRSVPVNFAIPYDLPPSDAPGSAPGKPINWHVTVRVDMPGVNYEALFQNVPVFATEASDPSFVRGTDGASSALGQPPGAKTRIVEDGPGRTVFALPPVKGVGCSLAGVVLLPLVTWLIAGWVAADPSEVSAATVVATLIAAGVLAVTCLGVAGTPVRLEIAGDHVDVVRGSGPLRRTRTIPIADIREIKYTTGQVGGSVAARTGSGEQTITGTLAEVDEAKWLAAEVMRAVERYRGQRTE
jgi:hypothetical protein